MSRVRKPENKYVNSVQYDKSITQATKLTRYKDSVTDYTKAQTLSSWLFLKYDMSYKTYSRKSQKRRAELRAEYMKDTNRKYFTKEEEHQAEVCQLLADMGIPFSPTCEPLGIGWDD